MAKRTGTAKFDPTRVPGGAPEVAWAKVPGGAPRSAFVEPPKRLPFPLGVIVAAAERAVGRRLMPARVLAWYPKAAVGSGVLEALVAHRVGRLDRRMLKLVRMQTSFAVSCPFCIDMNAFRFEEHGISDEEIRALRGLIELDAVATLSAPERLALRYARAASSTPISFDASLLEELHAEFTERELVVLASTIAQVNYWARLVQALGIAPAGFNRECAILALPTYRTVKER